MQQIKRTRRNAIIIIVVYVTLIYSNYYWLQTTLSQLPTLINVSDTHKLSISLPHIDNN